MSGQERHPFGKWLKRQLWAAELTQARFAKLGGFTPSMVSFWARGERLPAPESVEKIAEVLGLDVDEVLSRAGHRPADYDEESEAMRTVLGVMRRLPAAEQGEVVAFARWRLERHQRQARLDGRAADPR